MAEITTSRSARINNFMDALSDYISAKIDHDTNLDREWRNDHIVTTTGRILERAIEDLVR
jgi:hypothetical protein